MKTEMRLKVARAALGWSQEQLAVASGVPSWNISAYERGRRKLRYGEQVMIGTVLVDQLGGTISQIFPSFIPKNQATDGLLSELAGTERRTDR